MKPSRSSSAWNHGDKTWITTKLVCICLGPFPLCVKSAAINMNRLVSAEVTDIGSARSLLGSLVASWRICFIADISRFFCFTVEWTQKSEKELCYGHNSCYSLLVNIKFVKFVPNKFQWKRPHEETCSLHVTRTLLGEME